MSTSDIPPSYALHRLATCSIGVEGAEAIAAVLKESNLSELGCAASRSQGPTHPTCQTAMNTLPRSHDRSVGYNGLDADAKQALQAAAGSGVKLSM